MRNDTSSLAFGIEGRFGAGSSGGFVVAALNAASATCSGSLVRRDLSKAIESPPGQLALGASGALNLPRAVPCLTRLQALQLTIFPAHPPPGRGRASHAVPEAVAAICAIGQQFPQKPASLACAQRLTKKVRGSHGKLNRAGRCKQFQSSLIASRVLFRLLLTVQAANWSRPSEKPCWRQCPVFALSPFRFAGTATTPTISFRTRSFAPAQT